MSKNITLSFLAALALSSVHLAQAQQTKIYRIGVIQEGGPTFESVLGLKEGLRQLRFDEGNHYLLEIRDLKGDRSAAEEAARSLERGRVDLIYAVATSVTINVKRATTEVPIVFVIGGDPVVSGLVESFAKPGGRLTGVHYLSTDLTAKRLEILKEILPGLPQGRNVLRPSQ
jgi:putative ABC transport system substrate-binding protein